MTRSVLAGVAYFAMVFAIAFALGVLRVTFIVPAVGELWATWLELPFTLAASWFVCGWLVRILGVGSLGEAIGMGAGAFALLMVAEAVGSMLLFGRSLEGHIASYATNPGALGLAGQIAFGLFPVVQQKLGAASAVRIDGVIDSKTLR
jgi:hypothetical protein